MSNEALFLVIISGIFLLRLFLWYRGTASQKGKRGEARVAKILSRLPEEYITLNDVVFAYGDRTTQIDHIVVSPYGIFTIETKNYRGVIYGSDDKDEWKQIIKTRVIFRKKWYKVYTYITKNTLYNPVRQSIGHSVAIRKLIETKYDLPVVPIVTFTGKADLSNIRSQYPVVRCGNLLSVIRTYESPYLSPSDVMDIVDILRENNVRDSVSNRQHAKSVKAVKKQNRQIVNSGKCPRCGALLVKRKGPYGSFYGCSRYPDCRFTVEA